MELIRDLTIDDKMIYLKDIISDPIDVELKGLKTKIRKFNYRGTLISIPYDFTICIVDLKPKGKTYSTDSDVIIKFPEYLQDKNIQIIFYNNNPKVVDWYNLLGDPLAVTKECYPEYDDFITGICTSVTLIIKKKKIKSYVISYIDGMSCDGGVSEQIVWVSER